jgi:ribosomal protein S18 acetylase RimI-like enzyme
VKHYTPVTEAARGLRAATSADVEAIATVWHDGWRDGHIGHVPDALLPHRRLVDFRARVPPRLPQTTVATVGPDLVGFVMVRDDEIEQLYVAAGARGSGVATELFRHAEKVIGHRFDRAWLAVAAGNARARRFYERSGWRDAGAFDYGAEIAGGTIPVPCRRYERQLGREEG